MSMNGQWLGSYEGASTGLIIVNIDKDEQLYVGSAYLADNNPPATVALFYFPNTVPENDFSFRSLLQVWDSETARVVPWESVKVKYPNADFPNYADVKGSCNADSLNLSWTTDKGTTGHCTLPRSKADQPSELQAMEKNWDSYKQHVSGLLHKRYLFRGQDQPWRLRTSFHRTGRAEMHRFVGLDIQQLIKHLSARTKHVFNLNVPDENGAFFNLVQHHGYPTPLLDWTYSPYVAAFFAYRGVSNRFAAMNPDRKVRILVFDQKEWRQDYPQFLTVISPTLHVSIGEFLAIENERMIPQQAASLVTNIDDIESYIKSMETAKSKKYLTAIDLPLSDRTTVVRELSYMGITAGSLFPGLDGACEDLKERNFQI
jgi:hypothetical protein